MVLRFIIPLADITVQSSSDEKQLSEKAQGILKSRLSKAKDLPSDIDSNETTILTELHERGRRSSSLPALASLSQYSIYVAKVMLNGSSLEPVVACYRQSLVDFITRKNSALNTTFFSDFISRFPAAGWQLRDDIVNLATKAVNTYRRCQVFQLIQCLAIRATSLVSLSIMRYPASKPITMLRTVKQKSSEDS